MIKKLFCSLVVFGCVAGVMSSDDVNAMDDKEKAEDGLFFGHGLGFLPGRLSVLVVSTPDEWAESFRSIDRGVSILLEENEVPVFSDLSRVVISLSYPRTLQSLYDFCSGPQFDEKSRRTLRGLIMLFSRLAIKLDEPDSVLLSSSLISLAGDLTNIQNYLCANTHPISLLAEKLAKKYRELPED